MVPAWNASNCLQMGHTDNPTVAAEIQGTII